MSIIKFRQQETALRPFLFAVMRPDTICFVVDTCLCCIVLCFFVVHGTSMADKLKLSTTSYNFAGVRAILWHAFVQFHWCASVNGRLRLSVVTVRWSSIPDVFVYA